MYMHIHIHHWATHYRSQRATRISADQGASDRERPYELWIEVRARVSLNEKIAAPGPGQLFSAYP